jgi:transcriptional regulator with XRE-family HTH domain
MTPQLKFKLWRVAKGMSQEDAAMHLGVTRQTISNLETGHHKPTKIFRDRLWMELGIRQEEWHGTDNQ